MAIYSRAGGEADCVGGLLIDRRGFFKHHLTMLNSTIRPNSSVKLGLSGMECSCNQTLN